MITTRRIWSVKKSALMVWGSVLSAGVFVSLFTSARLPTVVDVVLRQPLILVTSILLIALLIKYLLRTAPKETLQALTHVVPAALVIGVLGALTSLWNDGSGVHALTLKEAGTFIFTGGLFPRAVGPEALMRISLFALSILLSVRVCKKGKALKKGFMTFFIAWFSSAVVMLIPTWMALGSAWLRRFPILHSKDVVRSLGLMHTDSFWSSFQADRFFAGIGSELFTASALSTSAVLLVTSLVILFLLGRKKGEGEAVKMLRSQFNVLKSAESLFLLSGALGGFIVGIRGNRFSWGGVDSLAVLLLVLVVGALTLIWVHGKKLEHYDALLLLAILGGGLLGWPALVLVLAFLFVTWLLSIGEFKWKESLAGQAIAMSVGILFVVSLGGVIGARSPLYPHELSGWIAAWAILVAAVTVLRKISDAKRKDLKIVALIAVLGVIGFLPLLSIYVLCALLALYLLGIWFAWQKKEHWDRSVVLASLVFAWVATILSYIAL